MKYIIIVIMVGLVGFEYYYYGWFYDWINSWINNWMNGSQFIDGLLVGFLDIYLDEC